jgi:hypothetical protein
MGQRIEDLTPHIFALVPTRIANRRTATEGIVEMAWIRDLRGTITWAVLSDFLTLSEVIADFSLSDGVLDKHIWKFSPTGQYSSKSAYDMLFLGSVSFGAFERVQSAVSSFGLSCTIDAGPQTVLLKEDYPTPVRVPFATKKRKQYNIFSSLASLQDSSGTSCCTGLGCLIFDQTMLFAALMTGGAGLWRRFPVIANQASIL